MKMTCSCCGQQKKGVAFNMIADGWRTYSAVIYCPKCSETWEDRNGTNRPLDSAEETRRKVVLRLSGKDKTLCGVFG